MSPLARARRGAQAAFATQGLIYISLTARLPDFQDRWGLSDLMLSLLLLMMVLLAGVGSVVVEKLAEQHPSARLLRVGLLAIAIAVPVVTTAPAIGVFIAGLALYGIGLGAVDAGTNMQAVALEHAYARTILPSFFGAWTLGGVLGAALALALGDTPLWTDALLAAVPLSAATLPLLPRAGAVITAGLDGVPWRPIVLVGLGMVLFYMVDTAAQTWGPTYLDSVFPTPHRLVALATFPYLIASLAMRMAGDRLVARHGAVPVLRVGALIACGALAVVVFAPTWPIAVLGFTVLGAGVAVIAPLSFSAAAAIAGGGTSVEERARIDTVIARFNQFNYVGALFGAVLTGVAGSGNLRIGFAVPMVLILAMLPLARAFAPAHPAPAQRGINAQ